MPRPRFQNLPAEKRDALIGIAGREFAAHGYAGASINRIIEEGGFSKGSFYYYFDDKEDLFLTVILTAHEKAFDFMGDLPVVRTSEEFWKALGEMMEKISHFAMENPVVMGLQRSFAAALAGGELKTPRSAFQQPHYDFHRRFVRVGQEVGAVRTDLPEELLLPILEAIDEAGDNWLARRYDEIKPGDWERIMVKFLRLYRRILEPGPDTVEKMP